MSTTIEKSAADCRCPTCGARQTLSDSCRRCKCDLSLYRGVVEAAERVRRACLVELHHRRHDEAIVLAEQWHELVCSLDSKRLLAVCYLLAGELPTARRLGHEILREEAGD